MPKRLVDSTRLGRARKIGQKAVLEFNVVNEQPLIAYCLIKGSAKIPYKVIIDLEKNIVGHSCPDFDGSGRRYNRYGRGGWCKHLGKLLLLLENDQVNNIYQQSDNLQVIRGQAQMDSLITEYKQKVIVEADGKDASEKVSLEDALMMINKLFKEGGDYFVLNKLVSTIFPQINDTIKGTSDISNLIFIESITHGFSVDHTRKFDGLTGGMLENKVMAINQRFKNEFWYRNTIYRLEHAFYLRTLNSKLGIDYSLNLKLPANLDADEIIDAGIILTYLNQLKGKIRTRLLDLPKDTIESRRKILIDEVNIKGTSVPALPRIIQDGFSLFSLGIHKEVDDFLIYILKSSKTQLDYTLKQRYNVEFYTIPNSLTENPVFKFIYERIKAGGRDYITKAEVRAHQKLFSWLGNKSVKEHWVEMPRTRIPETQFPSSGILIQWDISALHTETEFLKAYDHNRKIVIDSSSPITRSIQPFDITLCVEELKDVGNYTKKAYPLFILQPDQVIELLYHGFRIISDVLPWSKLERFIQKGKLDSGEVTTGINQCNTLSFVYGAPVLASELEKLSYLGKHGSSDDQYSSIYANLSKDTGRLNTRSRPLLRDLLIAEGKPLKMFLENLYKNENQVLNALLYAVRKSPTIEEFRDNIIGDQLSKNKMFLDTNFIKMILNEDMGSYNIIKQQFSEILKDEFRKLKKVFLTSEEIKLRPIRDNMLGNLILSETFGQLRGSVMSEQDAEIFEETLYAFKKHF